MAKQNIGSRAASAKALQVSNIIKQRGKTHGDAFENLQDIGNRWDQYLKNRGYTGPGLTVDDIAYMMVELKLSRAAFGDKNEKDHLNDIMGYSAIGAAYLEALPTIGTKEKE